MDDSPKPQHSHHPASASGSSTRNNPPELPPLGGGGSTRKRKRTASDNNEPEEDEEDEDVDIIGLSSPPKLHQTESSAQKEADEDTATTTVVPLWRREEINLLKDILDFYHKTGRYPYPDMDDLQDFFKNWVQKRGFYRDEMNMNIKMDRLNTRFLMNMEKKSNGEDIEAMMDPTEIEIFRLSNRVWGKKDDNDHDNAADDDRGGDEDAAAMNAGGSRPWREEEIKLLNDILDFYKNNGRYPFDDFKDLHEFYEKWIEGRTRVYTNDEVDLKKKMDELHARFLQNLEKTRNGEVLEDIEEWMDPIDVKIYRLSYRIWGNEDDIEFDDDDIKDSLG